MKCKRCEKRTTVSYKDIGKYKLYGDYEKGFLSKFKVNIRTWFMKKPKRKKFFYSWIACLQKSAMEKCSGHHAKQSQNICLGCG